MGKWLAYHPVLLVSVAITVSLIVFRTASLLLSEAAGSSSIAVSNIIETREQRTARVAREQIAKDWKAAQRRVEVRRTEGGGRRFKSEKIPHACEP
jgi:hypothetical protein